MVEEKYEPSNEYYLKIIYTHFIYDWYYLQLILSGMSRLCYQVFLYHMYNGFSHLGINIVFESSVSLSRHDMCTLYVLRVHLGRAIPGLSNCDCQVPDL